jgi:hypothetical protein
VELLNATHGSTHNYRHFAPFDFVPGSKPVIVIGDSFVGAELNSYDNTLQRQLGKLLGGQERVYGLGANGLSISDYLALSKMAAAEFSPTAVVILVVDGDITEGLEPQVGHYHFSIEANHVELQYWPLTA